MDLESEALREAYAVAPADTVVLDTLEIDRSGPGDTPIYLTNNYTSFTAEISPGTSVTFQAIPFSLKLPEKLQDTLPSLSVAIANPNQVISDYLRASIGLGLPIFVKFRQFLAKSNGTVITNQMPTPMTFHIGPVQYGLDKVEVQCLFPNIANRRFPNENYTVRKFPGLRGW